MDERMKFIDKLLQGKSMAQVCREFGISHKTGYKFFTRYKDVGILGLTDRAKRPIRYANQPPTQLKAEILRIKRDKPSWGRS
jgi:transposase